MIGDRKSRNATTLFLVSLSAADLLLLLVCAPVSIIFQYLLSNCICWIVDNFLISFYSGRQLEVSQYFVIQWDEAGIICKTAKYAEVLSAVASVLNLTAVSIERQVAIQFFISCTGRVYLDISHCDAHVLET